MADLRFKALQEVFSRQPKEVNFPSNEISDYFGLNVFDRPKMEKFLNREAFRSVMKAIDSGTAIDRKMADQVATGMKAWAVDMGATHYTHWFHPLTDGTAEKHDGFIEFGQDGNLIENFCQEDNWIFDHRSYAANIEEVLT